MKTFRGRVMHDGQMFAVHVTIDAPHQQDKEIEKALKIALFSRVCFKEGQCKERAGLML
jgi:hypothetical protein